MDESIKEKADTSGHNKTNSMDFYMKRVPIFATDTWLREILKQDPLISYPQLHVTATSAGKSPSIPSSKNHKNNMVITCVPFYIEG